MENKKNKSVDIEKMKGLFFQVGLVLVLLVTISIFEYGTVVNNSEEVFSPVEIDFQQEMVPVTIPNPPKPETEKIPKKIVEVFNLKSNDEDLLKDLNIFGTEDIDLSALFIIDTTTEKTNDEIWDKADIDPRFPGGLESMYNYLANNIHFDEEAISNNVSGKVYVEFVINKQGQINNVKIVKSIHPSLDQEVINAIKGMPQWTPGIKNGEIVNVRYRMPVKFNLIK